MVRVLVKIDVCNFVNVFYYKIVDMMLIGVDWNLIRLDKCVFIFGNLDLVINVCFLLVLIILLCVKIYNYIK